jgi:2,3-bisphosphoglycerate-independent phosphoglycerate mutase
MDSLCRRGVTGLMDIIGPGIKVGTDIGHLALFGQNASNRLYQRGPMEAVGAGVDLQPGDIALRFNFATLDGDQTILDRRAGRIRDEVQDLIGSLNAIPFEGPVSFSFHSATEHRGVLVLRGEGLSPLISDSDPGDLSSGAKIRRIEALTEDPAATRTAEITTRILALSRAALKDHPVNMKRRNQGKLPANALLTRGAGTRQSLIDLPAYLGLSIACISGETTVLGIAEMAGFDTITSPKMTANLDTDLHEKGLKTVEALELFDVVYLHIKGCDIAGHDRLPEAKRDFIEKTDEMLAEILERTDHMTELHVAFAGDHSTLSETGEHSGDPVPVLLAGPTIQPDSVTQYGERFCADGGLGRLLCSKFLAKVLDEPTFGRTDSHQFEVTIQE